MSVYTSADPTIQPPAHISPFTPPISSSLLVCQYLAPGWLGVWLELFLFKSFWNCSDVSLMWHALKLCMRSLILSCLLCPRISITLLYFVKKGENGNLPSAGSIGWISNPPFHFYHSHWKSCWCFSFAVTYHIFTNFTRHQGVKFLP